MILGIAVCYFESEAELENPGNSFFFFFFPHLWSRLSTLAISAEAGCCSSGYVRPTGVVVHSLLKA